MPRRARLVIPEVPVHVIQRGHNRNACFLDQYDRQYYLHWLAILAREAGCDVHAYVLMTNHIHLALTPHAHTSQAQLMKSLNQRFAAYMNKKYGRSGTWWEGRHKSCLIFDEEYFLVCMRYIELNPQRAGMVEHPRDYPWSSYGANAEGMTNPIIVPHPIYLALGATEVDRLLTYRRLVATADHDDLIAELRHSTNRNYVVGK